MQLFFHDVGLKGANADFPKTIFNQILVSDIVNYCPEYLKHEVESALLESFPDGACNVWGVPAGARSVIRQLSQNDVMLLIKSTGGDEEIPVLCHVKAFWKEELIDLSKFLWGSTHFPYVFFFKTQDIHLTWSMFKEHVQYLPNFRPSGNVYRVKSERLEKFGGTEGYVTHLLKSPYVTSSTMLRAIEERTPDSEYVEGQRYVRETGYFKRNPKLVADAKLVYGYVCQVCDFDFEKFYGELGKKFIECHHKNPLSEIEDSFISTIEDVCVICSNCHRMLHRSKPAMKPEELKIMVFKKLKIDV